MMRMFSCGTALMVLTLLTTVSCEAQQSGPKYEVQTLPPMTLATVDGAAVTETDLDKGLEGKAKGQLLKARMEMYQAKREALDSYLDKKLGEEQAKKVGKTYEQLIAAEVTNKIKKVTDSDIKKFYDDYKKKNAGAAHSLPPLDQVKDRIKQKLEQDRRQEREVAFSEELRKKHKVTIQMTQPRAEVAKGETGPRGSAKAPIEIVMFSDYQCPFCKRAEESVSKVLKEYKGKVSLYFRDYPLAFHDRAKPAAEAARCAAEQGKYWEYHDKLFEKQQLSDEDLVKHAKDLKLDIAKFEPCVKGQKYKEQIEKDIEAGSDVGVTGTPAFFINGIPLSGAQPFETFKKTIDAELAQLKQAGKKV
jgi:protein-disulfide isomerase